MNQYSFEKLDVWHYAKDLVRMVYGITSEFPPEEKYGLTSQLRRSAISVCSNIAEGSARWGQKDKARFYEMAYSSLTEVMNQLLIAYDLGYVGYKKLMQARELIERISRMLNSLYESALE